MRILPARRQCKWELTGGPFPQTREISEGWHRNSVVPTLDLAVGKPQREGRIWIYAGAIECEAGVRDLLLSLLDGAGDFVLVQLAHGAAVRIGCQHEPDQGIVGGLNCLQAALPQRLADRCVAQLGSGKPCRQCLG